MDLEFDEDEKSCLICEVVGKDNELGFMFFFFIKHLLNFLVFIISSSTQ